MAKLFTFSQLYMVFTSMMQLQGKVSVNANEEAHSFSKMERPRTFRTLKQANPR